MVLGVADQSANAAAAGQTVLPVYIDSGGGSVHSALSILNILSTCGMRVITCVTGVAASAACVILTAGVERYCAPNAVCMIHDVSLEGLGMGRMKSEDLAAEARETKRLWKQLCFIMAHACGKPRTHFYDLVRSRRNTDCYITPQDAMVKHGLVTNFGVPRLVLRVKLEYDVMVGTGAIVPPSDPSPITSGNEDSDDDSSAPRKRVRA